VTSIGSTVAPTSARPRAWAGLGFVAPFLAVFALVFVAPIGYSLYLSVTYFSGTVDENDHIIPGGYPGGLRDVLESGSRSSGRCSTTTASPSTAERSVHYGPIGSR
jgi:ABC-type sugar transport system permease subunit